MERVGGADAFLDFAGLSFLTMTSGVSAYKAAAAAAAAGDVGSVAFVGASYTTLLLLFRRLRAYERLPPPAGAADDNAGGRRRRLKREVWALCTLLTVLFSWKVAAAMPSWPVAVAVWTMAVITVVGGFLALFRHP